METIEPGKFVCPEWAINLWDREHSFVTKCVGGNYAVVCNAVQSTIFTGTQEQCRDFLSHDDTRDDCFDCEE